MVSYTATILKFANQGEKTGWTYLEVPAEIAEQIKPNTKTGFRVKGKLDAYPIQGVSLLPMGKGDFIMPLNATMRKNIRKNIGAVLQVQLEEDTTQYEICSELLDCLGDEPDALEFFQKLPKSHQNYYSKWVESAKTDITKAKRIMIVVTASIKKMRFNEMMHWQREHKKE